MIKAVIFDMYETLITLCDGPVYLSEQMAEDAGIEKDKFQSRWRATETDRTIGRITVDEVLRQILCENDCYSDRKVKKIMENRIRYKEGVFEHMHPEILPLLDGLKENGIRVGLISNCHSEEAVVIRRSILSPYFDAVCLSYEEGIKKPDHAIFYRCLERLKLLPEECLYVGDGGSQELEAAKAVGMMAVQAVWYLKEGTRQPVKRMEEYQNIESPLAIIDMLRILITQTMISGWKE